MKYFFIIVVFCTSLYSIAHAEITRTLSIGSSGADVRELQVFLNSDPDTQIASSGVGSPGNESIYFGTRTFDAVKKFQIKYALQTLAPLGMSAPSGVVGSLTRTLIFRLQQQHSFRATTPSTSQVVPVIITTMSPLVIGTNPQYVTLTGSGFTSTGNTITIASDSTTSIGSFNSTDGKSLSFSFTSSTADKIVSQLARYRGRSDYPLIVSSFIQNISGDTIIKQNNTAYLRAILTVSNTHGQSNSFPFMIDLGQLLK